MILPQTMGFWPTVGGSGPTVRDGVTFYLEGVPAGTALLGTTGRVTSSADPVVVDWGDGTSDTIACASTMRIPAHTYSAAGDYEINVSCATLTEIRAYSSRYFPTFTMVNKSDLPYLKRVTFGNDLENVSLGSYTFARCSSLVTVYFSECVISLGSYTFRDCSGLTNVTIPDSVTSLGSSCFNGCSGLTNVTIPDSVTSLGNSCFNGCSGLTNLTCKATTPPSVGTNAFSGVTSTIPVYVPSASIAAYQAATGWGDYFTNIQAIST